MHLDEIDDALVTRGHLRIKKFGDAGHVAIVRQQRCDQVCCNFDQADAGRFERFEKPR
jgi:hypothetical protein